MKATILIVLTLTAFAAFAQRPAHEPALDLSCACTSVSPKVNEDIRQQRFPGIRYSLREETRTHDHDDSVWIKDGYLFKYSF